MCLVSCPGGAPWAHPPVFKKEHVGCRYHGRSVAGRATEGFPAVMRHGELMKMGVF
jgi:hypothetical protein